MEVLGAPEAVTRVLKTSYLDCDCRIAAGGALWEGFSMCSASAMGCPLSPLVFAVVMDALLQRLTAHIPGSHTHNAFADDVGIVLEDVRGQLPSLVHALTAFGTISGMNVNVDKTVGVGGSGAGSGGGPLVERSYAAAAGGLLGMHDRAG